MRERMYLLGDEDGGVSLYCRDCWDGGRPLAYYEPHGSMPYRDDLVENATTVPALMAGLHRHEREVHSVTAATGSPCCAHPST